MNKEQIERLYELERGLHELKKELKGESLVTDLITQACKAFNCSRSQLRADSKLHFFADIRKIIAYQAEQKKCSRREIALMLNRDVSSISSAIRNYKHFVRNEDPQFLEMVERFNSYKLKIAA